MVSGHKSTAGARSLLACPGGCLGMGSCMRDNKRESSVSQIEREGGERGESEKEREREGGGGHAGTNTSSERERGREEGVGVGEA